MIYICENEESIAENYDIIFYKYASFNRVYSCLSDTNNINFNKNEVIFIFEMIKNETIKINKLKIPKGIIKYLKDIYITEKNKKICNKDNYNKKTFYSDNETLLNISFDKTKLNEIIDEEIILNYTLINKKNKSKDCLIEE